MLLKSNPQLHLKNKALLTQLAFLILIKLKIRQAFPEEVEDLLLTLAVNIDSLQTIEEIILMEGHQDKPKTKAISEQRVMRSSIIYK